VAEALLLLRSLKSVLVSVALPVWRIVMVSSMLSCQLQHLQARHVLSAVVGPVLSVLHGEGILLDGMYGVKSF
jgi:hypothetical protein